MKDQNSTRATEPDTSALLIPEPELAQAHARTAVSGLYECKGSGIGARTLRAELRLDVDGIYPLMRASGTVTRQLSSQVHWVATLRSWRPPQSNRLGWRGTIFFKDGDTSDFPYRNVEITVQPHSTPSQMRAQVVFSVSGRGQDLKLPFVYRSPYFHPVSFEFDHVDGVTPIQSIQTGDHPNRPPTLARENLTIRQVYQRAGFNVTTSPSGTVPISGAGPNARWSDQEMHDAMQTYWSRFDSRAQWAMWVFFASQHNEGASLGGVMFDDIGPQHRQGTAIFTNSFISQPPADDPNPDAWIRRMIFWTACHEMGHAFNLAHSWEKAYGNLGWIPLADDPEARSFMNYPYYVQGGSTAFFDDFEYRFSDEELLFMRHAPARFVQMGNAQWFDHHGFRSAAISAQAEFRLDLRVNRDQPIFEFMEPVTLELKLSNASGQPKLIDEFLLSSSGSLVVILKKDGQPARQFAPFSRYCREPRKKALMPGETAYESLFVSAGLNGWDMAEPGNYTIQVAVSIDGEDIVSNPLRLRVAPPAGYDEEYLAQDFFSEDVGRIVALDGSQCLKNGNDVLREVSAKLKGRRVARHASVALGQALTKDYKTLIADPAAPAQGLKIATQPPKPDEAQQLLSSALVENMSEAIESFGHIDAKWYVDQFSDWLAKQGDGTAAAKTQDALYKTLSNRSVRGRKILDSVLQGVKEKRDGYQKK